MRVLGALMEKAITTPEYYPLTLNSLTSACNQKTSRFPVSDYDEDEILGATDSLRDKNLVLRVDVAGSRVPKFRQKVKEEWELTQPEYSLLCVLLLRGPQTPGQLRQRTDRLHSFPSVKEVEETLEEMKNREEEPLEMIRSLPRQPGTKEIRYALWLHDNEAMPIQEKEVVSYNPKTSDEDALSQLTSKMETLETKINNLEERIRDLEGLV